MPHSLHLIRSTSLFGGSTLNDLDLDNAGGSSKFRLLNFIRGEPRFKDTHANSPVSEGRRLVAYQLDDVDEEIHLSIEAASLDQLLAQLALLDRFMVWIRDAQVGLNASGQAPFYCWLSDRPLNLATKTFKYHLKLGSVQKPRALYDTNMLAWIAGEPDDPIIVRLTRYPYVSASVLTILNGVSADNGAGAYVDIGASGGTDITGDLPSPLSVKVAGGDTTTNRLLLSMRTRGTPSNFKQIYWAKDATFTGNTVARNGDTTFDGDGSNNGTRTTAANISENKTHRWENATNVADQYGKHRVFLRCRSNTAGRYTARVKVGISDGSNDYFPNDEFGGFLTEDAQAIGAASGNALAWVDLGELTLPPVETFGAAVARLVFELYLTCSDVAGAPTCDVDAGVWLMPLDDGPVDTGFVQATFPFATGAPGVASALVSAIPGDPQAALLNGSDVTTFPVVPDAGSVLFGMPNTAARLFLVLLDAGNTRHDYTHALTVTVTHELRHAAVIGA